MRKIEKINTLDQETSKLKAENDELAGLAAKLKEQVYKLQQELQWHVNNGCQVRIGHHHNALQILTESFDSIVLDHNEVGCHEETGCRSQKYKAPRGHRVRRGNTKENMQSCKLSF